MVFVCVCNVMTLELCIAFADDGNGGDGGDDDDDTGNYDVHFRGERLRRRRVGSFIGLGVT